ncbi:MAG: RagB/SusD family nutrient uptake outer membrane protein [Parabacteroides sp.]|nr:RagB/SusD family nutrient uptake outer membrane protein [Parabacteroides sp.]
MKKWIYTTVAAFAAGSLLTACSSDYLDTVPTNKTPAENITGMVDGLASAVNGTHRAMYDQYSRTSEAGESSMNITRDMMGEDLVNSSTGNGWYIADARWISHRDENSLLLRYIFNYYYRLVLNANLILENIDEATGENDVLRRGVKGEALCFRAFSHFQMVQLFGKRYVPGADNTQPGIPYREAATIAPIARNSVEEVYGKINRDLDEALGLLDTYAPADINHFSLKVAYGLKARVALTQGNWNDAAAFADKAIELAEADGNQLLKGDDLLNGFVSAGRNKDWMWASLMKEDQTIFFYSFFAFMSWNYNSTNVRTDPKCINDLLYARISPTDTRAQWWDPTGTLPGPTGSFTTAKYQNWKFSAQSPATSVGDIVYMRLAEMYLIKAEALARAGRDTEAVTTLTDFAVTRDPAFATTNTGAALIDEIMVQRRVELWGEGFRFTDLKRLDLPLDRNGSNHILSVSRIMEVPAGDKRWEFLIPQREIETNPEMVQNEL